MYLLLSVTAVPGKNYYVRKFSNLIFSGNRNLEIEESRRKKKNRFLRDHNPQIMSTALLVDLRVLLFFSFFVKIEVN